MGLTGGPGSILQGSNATAWELRTSLCCQAVARAHAQGEGRGFHCSVGRSKESVPPLNPQVRLLSTCRGTEPGEDSPGGFLEIMGKKAHSGRGTEVGRPLSGHLSVTGHLQKPMEIDFSVLSDLAVNRS